LNLADPSWDVAVIGAGAAGLIAAARAAEGGQRTLLLEKNARPGIKILMSGGTRCNITHATDNRGIIEAFGPPGRFLHSALAALSVQDTLELFAAEGVLTKVEPGGKIFPVSNKATDVLAALVRRLNRSGAELAIEEPLEKLEPNSAGFRLTTPKRSLMTAHVIVASGGQSYPGSGTTGDGYRWAAELGHTIIRPRPALAPITVAEPWVRELQGVTIPDVKLCVLEISTADSSGIQPKPRLLAERRGSLLFAHFGLSGPVVLDVSRVVSGHANPRQLRLECDFLPERSLPAWDLRLRDECARAGKKSVASLLPAELPKRLSESLLAAAGVPSERKAAEFGKQERGRVVEAFKQLRLAVTGTLGFKKAEVTAGGIALGEVDSRDLQSKLVPNLYLAGEVLDLDGPIGGYNFQAAWSTGWLAGQSVCK